MDMVTSNGLLYFLANFGRTLPRISKQINTGLTLRDLSSFKLILVQPYAAETGATSHVVSATPR